MKHVYAVCGILSLVVVMILPMLGGPALAADTPTIGSISPQPIHGGQIMTVKAAPTGNFGTTPGYVSLSGGNITDFGPGSGNTWGDQTITFVFPETASDFQLLVINSLGYGDNSVFCNVSPVISLSPSSAKTGDIVTVNGHSLFWTRWLTTNAKLYINNQEYPSVYIDSSAQKDNTFSFTVADTLPLGDVPVQVKANTGNSNTVNLHIEYAPVPTGWNRYFAEGCTRYGFDTWLELLVGDTSSNGGINEPLQVTYQTESGEITRAPIVTDKMKKVIIHVNDDVPDHDGVSTKISRSIGPQFAGHRMMYWGNATEGHMAKAQRSAEKTWYLPEGSTAWGFETWILVQNPFDAPVNITVTYMTDHGPVNGAPLTIAPQSRLTINAADRVPNSDFSTSVVSDNPILVERSMYWNNRRGGTDSDGACDPEDIATLCTPSQDIYLAEGSTGYGFDEWILVQNPNPEPVSIDMTYMTNSGPVAKPTFTIAGQSRYTVHANADIPSADISVKVHGSQPILAERAMYWDNGSGKAGHTQVGVSSTLNRWGFGAGHTEFPYETWILVQNPNDQPAKIILHIFDDTGEIAQTDYTVEAMSRQTVNLATFAPGKSVACYLSASNISETDTLQIISEEAIYWNNRTGGACSIGSSMGAQWFLTVTH